MSTFEDKPPWILPFELSPELVTLAKSDSPLGNELNKILWDYAKLWEEHMLATKAIRMTYRIAKKATEVV